MCQILVLFSRKSVKKPCYARLSSCRIVSHFYRETLCSLKLFIAFQPYLVHKVLYSVTLTVAISFVMVTRDFKARWCILCWFTRLACSAHI